MPITCPHCTRHFPDSDEINARHKRVCAGWQTAIEPLKVLPCLCGHEATSLTQMKRHRQKCETWKGRDRGEVQTQRLVQTLRETYGMEEINSLRDVPGTEEKRKATMRERYGADHAFDKDSTLRPKIDAGIEAARPEGETAANPFAWVVTKAKIRETMQARYGATHPMHVPELKERARDTVSVRHGGFTLASPALRSKVEATSLDRYGVANAGGAPEVVERARQTNLKRWGVEWTCQDPSVQQRQAETMARHYGGHYFASEEGRAEVRRVLMERYGVDCASRIDDFWVKAVVTFTRKYGAAHPLLLVEFLEKRRQTCLERFGFDSPVKSPEVYERIIETCQQRFGVDYALQAKEVRDKGVQTNLEKYGVPHPMMNREYARKHLEKMRTDCGPNLLEADFARCNPELRYTGNGVFWRWLPRLKQHKNADFIVPGPDADEPRRKVTKVVEVFGSFWHSARFTKRIDVDHQAEVIEAYRGVGIECLVVWESEFRLDPAAVRERVLAHLGAPPITPSRPDSSSLPPPR